MVTPHPSATPPPSPHASQGKAMEGAAARASSQMMLPERANDVAYTNDVASQMMLRAKPVNDVNRGRHESGCRNDAMRRRWLDLSKVWCSARHGVLKPSDGIVIYVELFQVAVTTRCAADWANQKKENWLVSLSPSNACTLLKISITDLESPARVRRSSME